ncbi:MAG: hypothetical protein GY862_04200 [Gammaproteobacteria bacterium]|nr:hypothetical protein [Gammaproteobacteria bacterium]
MKVPDGIKKQVFGGVLFFLGIVDVMIALTMGFEVDTFYIVLIVLGVFIFLYGTTQRN